MPQFNVATLDGKLIAIDSVEASPDAVMDMARTRGHLVADEVISATGREMQGYKIPIAIAFHAIIAIRPKR